MYRTVIRSVPGKVWEGFGALGAAWEVFKAEKCRGEHPCWCCRMEERNKEGHWKVMGSNH